MSWLHVVWADAEQVIALCAIDVEKGAGLGIPPKAFFDGLVAREANDDAIAFLGAALPRQAAVQWSLATLEQASAAGRSAYGGELLDAVRAWLAAPGDKPRRRAWELVRATEESSPERLLASAIFYSGGSIAPEDCEPVQPEPHLCGRLSATAILACAHAREDVEAIMRFAVAEGDRIASS